MLWSAITQPKGKKTKVEYNINIHFLVKPYATLTQKILTFVEKPQSTGLRKL